MLYKHSNFELKWVFHRIFCSTPRFPLKPDRFTGLTGGNRLNYHFLFGIWIWPVFSVTDQTDLVYRNRTAPVSFYQSVKKKPLGVTPSGLLSAAEAAGGRSRKRTPAGQVSLRSVASRWRVRASRGIGSVDRSTTLWTELIGNLEHD